MTAAEYAKSLGLHSLAELETASGVKRRTLTNWFHDRPDAFRLLCLGVVVDRAVTGTPRLISDKADTTPAT